MIQLKRRLAERHPHWFGGHRARIARPMLRTLGRWSRLDAINAFLAANSGLRGFAFIEAALAFLQAGYRVEGAERTRIPARGRLLIVANHPSGALDALALLHQVGSVRQDVKIVADDVLCASRRVASWCSVSMRISAIRSVARSKSTCIACSRASAGATSTRRQHRWRIPFGWPRESRRCADVARRRNAGMAADVPGGAG